MIRNKKLVFTRVKTKRHIDKPANNKKAAKPESVEVGVITTTASFGETIESPNPSWIHKMKVFYPNGVKHFMRVLLAHGFYTFDDACSDFHKNPEPFRMFFKSTGLETETENTLEVLQIKLLQGFRKVEEELVQYGWN